MSRLGLAHRVVRAVERGREFLKEGSDPSAGAIVVAIVVDMGASVCAR
jgi:hypothetical protein